MVVQEVLDVLVVVVALIPVMVQLLGFLSAKTHNQKLINLRMRAEIIVEALEQTGLSNAYKKGKAMEKLSEYAKEVGIQVTPDQLDDYIESAVNLVKALSK